MKIPPALLPLVEDGVVDSVERQLKSGKEASVFIVRSGTERLCAKVYKDLATRSFQARSQYQEGRKVRGSREQRSLAKGSRFGKREQETAWKNSEVDALYRLSAAGVRVPQPRGHVHGVLLMELVADEHGDNAPRLGEVELTPEDARRFHALIVADIVRMLCLGLIHGDLSEYNVLVAPDGPVIIDLPQAVDASGNLSARPMLLRDVHNIRDTLARFAPELAQTHYGEEMWLLYELGELRPDTVLTGEFTFDEHEADVDAVMESIIDAQQEALIRQQGREAAEEDEAA